MNFDYLSTLACSIKPELGMISVVEMLQYWPDFVYLVQNLSCKVGPPITMELCENFVSRKNPF